MSKLPENCPICGEKMEKGWLVHPWHFRWSSSKEKPSWWVRQFRSKKGTEDLTKPDFWGVKGTAVKANKCPNCKIVLFSYGDEQEGQ